MRLHRIGRLMRTNALRARPRPCGPAKDEGERSISAVPPNALDSQFSADQPNREWIAHFTYVWTAERPALATRNGQRAAR